ncbi:MAG: radical SAM protein [Clostridiaceae bacterium]
MLCSICPRKCNADREKAAGFCGMGFKPVIARAFLHMWEEPCISGTKGSGTVFFSGCNLKCIFCQNHEISHGGRGREVSTEELAAIFLSLRDKGAHNINLVTPSHFVPAILEALEIAKTNNPAPLDIPIVYNTSGYDSLGSLKMLEGSIDIYLPDLKYISPDVSMRYSGAKDYFEKASRAIFEMYRQTGAPILDESGIMKRGIIIRHLVLPGHVNESLRILEWIAENLPGDVPVSLMSQYVPCHLASEHAVLGRRLTRYEYDKVLNKYVKLGLKGFYQERGAASEEFIPDFSRAEF